MPKRGQGDDSPGDRRKPFSDRGGPSGRHRETHDVRREQVTNPTGIQPPRETEAQFERDLGEAPHGGHDLSRAKAPGAPGHADDSFTAADAKAVYDLLPWMNRAELDQLPILKRGTRLEEGAVYLDLKALDRGPFKAIGGETAEKGHLYVAKQEVDYELWNRLTQGRDEVTVERPAAER